MKPKTEWESKIHTSLRFMLDTSRFFMDILLFSLNLVAVMLTRISSAAIWHTEDRCNKMGLMSANRPKNMTDRPVFGHRLDPLSEIFGSMRIQDAIYTRMEATAPWGFHYPGDTVPRIRFGLMVRGSAVLKFKNQRQAIPLSAGDVFIFILSNEPFTVVDHPRSRVVDYRELRKLEVDCVIHYGGGGALTTLVSGSFGMSAFEAPLIATILPRHLHLRLEQNRSHAFQSVLDLLAAETAQPGIASSRLISCLYESLFVYAIRAYASSSAAPPKSWLAAMSDKHLSKAIQAMHSGIDRSWSVESLAREARMSRSAFALKFKTVLGQTPLEYLTRWRMHKAGAMIRSDNTSFSEVASAIGYGSESSFSRVFRREMGLAPREYRRKSALLQSSIGGE
ncbi:MAG TPA: AraC family transcriptional regulator [Candidatus Acidoferrales bacterium]|nr:AraC family transcriptional regulator [Candidatus Acidoferrales bacterium]